MTMMANGDVNRDAMLRRQAMDRLRGERNLGAGIAAGAVAAVIGAVGWAVITVITGYRIGFMAVGVGLLVGFAIQRFGKGFETSFGVSGAVLACLGCALGNLLAVSAIFSDIKGVPLLDVVLTLIQPSVGVDVLISTFRPMDVIFYGIAIYEGYRFSIRKLTGKEIYPADEPGAIEAPAPITPPTT